MEKLKKTALIFSPFILLTLLILFTDPYELPLPLLLVPFILLGAGVFGAAKELLGLMPVSRRKAIAISATLTATVLLGVLLQSIRQLSLKDFLILSVLLIGTTFYMRRIDI